MFTPQIMWCHSLILRPLYVVESIFFNNAYIFVFLLSMLASIWLIVKSMLYIMNLSYCCFSRITKSIDLLTADELVSLNLKLSHLLLYFGEDDYGNPITTYCLRSNSFLNLYVNGIYFLTLKWRKVDLFWQNNVLDLPTSIFCFGN